MREALVSRLDLVSTHGTGTPLGDPIESGALRRSAAGAGVQHPPAVAAKAHRLLMPHRSGDGGSQVGDGGRIGGASAPLHRLTGDGGDLGEFPSTGGTKSSCLTLTAVKVLTGHLEGCAGLAGLLQVGVLEGL